MDEKCFGELLLKVINSSSLHNENTNNFQMICKTMSFKELNKPEWWPSLQVLEQNLTADGLDLMCILRVLVYKCCEIFKKPSINVNLNDHFTNDSKSQIYSKRKHLLECNSSNKRQKALIPIHISNQTNLHTEKENTDNKYSTIISSDIEGHEQKTDNQHEFLANLGLRTDYINEKSTNIPWKSVKFKLTPNIPFSSNLGQILMKRDNHHLPDNLKRIRLERMERHINQPYKKNLNIKYDVTYPGRKLKDGHKLTCKKNPRQSIHNQDNIAITCKPLIVKLVRENLKILKEKIKLKQGELQILIPKLPTNGLRSDKETTNKGKL